MSVRLHIEHLIVQGAAIGDRSASDFDSSLRGHLVHLLQRQPCAALQAAGSINTLFAPEPLEIGNAADGASLGVAVAGSLHATLHNPATAAALDCFTVGGST